MMVSSVTGKWYRLT